MTTAVREETFDSIWSRWEEILPACVTDTVFVTPWWQKTWWDNFGGSREPRILSVHDGNDLLGIAPLMSDGDTLTFLGHKDLSDYFDFVVPQDRVDSFFPALWEHLLASPGWSTLDLPSLPGGSPTLERLTRLAENAGMTVEVEEEETTPTA